MSRAPAPVDLHDVLAERVPAFLQAVPDLSAMEVGLWEGGVRVALRVAEQGVVLKIRPREGDEVRAYAELPSALVALESEGTLERRTERVVRGLLDWIRKVDQGRLVVRKPEPEVEEEGPVLSVPPPTPDAPPAWNAVRLEDLEVACLADQRATVPAWADDVLVLLSPRPDPDGAVRAAHVGLVAEARARGVGRVAIGGVGPARHPDLGAVLDAARGTEVWLEADAYDAGVLPELAGRVAVVVVRGDAAGVPEVVAAARAAGMRVVAWLPATAACVAALDERAGALRAGGAEVWLVPPVVGGEAPDANPLDLSSAAARAGVALAGLPLCFAPGAPRADAPLPLWRLLDAGTRYGVVCRACTSRAACPGVAPDHLARWRTRGMVPALDL